MKNLEHCKIIAATVAEALSPYSHFAEVDELKSLVLAWVDGRIGFVDGQVVFGFSESSGAVGMIPSLSQSPE